MKQLVILRIETFPNGVKHLECSTRGPGTMFSDFEKRPKVICFLGDYYNQVDYDPDRKVIHYKTH